MNYFSSNTPPARAPPAEANDSADEHQLSWSIQALRTGGGGNAAQGEDKKIQSEAAIVFTITATSQALSRGSSRPKKVLIIGAGWYGCHCAMVCKRLGIAFDLVDSANAIMTESSVRNQNRLHLGFHYPRCFATRAECVSGHARFMSVYKHLTLQVPRNMYLVSKNSVIDFRTFANIFKYEKTPFTEVSMYENGCLPFNWLPEQYDGALLTAERMIDCEKVSSFFRSELGNHLIPGCSPGDIDMLSLSEEVSFRGRKYDLAFDCTYGQLGSDAQHVFELCCSWVYKFRHPIVVPGDLFGFTVMDGPFFSIFPYKPLENLFTLTHVVHTPLMLSTDIAEMRGAMASDAIAAKVKYHHQKALEHVTESVPYFSEAFEYQDHFLSIKCKSSLKNDDRSLQVRESKNVVSFCGGKITGIFSMEDYLLKRFSSTLPVVKVPGTSTADVRLNIPAITTKSQENAASVGALPEPRVYQSQCEK